MTYYLNNSGSRWTANGDTVRLIHPSKQYDKIRKVEFYSSFGNFAAVNLKYNGKRISILPDGKDFAGNVVCFVDYKDKKDYNSLYPIECKQL